MLFGSSSKVKTWTEVVTQTQFWSPITRALSQGGVFKAARIGPGFYTTGVKRDIKPPSASATRIRKASDLPLPGKLYVVASFLGFSVATALIVMLFSSTPWPLRALGGGVALWGLFCQGLLLDADGGKGRSMEAVRCLVCMALCVVMHGSGSGKLSVDDALGFGPQYRVSVTPRPLSLAMRAYALETSRQTHASRGPWARHGRAAVEVVM